MVWLDKARTYNFFPVGNHIKGMYQDGIPGGDHVNMNNYKGLKATSNLYFQRFQNIVQQVSAFKLQKQVRVCAVNFRPVFHPV